MFMACMACTSLSTSERPDMSCGSVVVVGDKFNSCSRSLQRIAILSNIIQRWQQNVLECLKHIHQSFVLLYLRYLFRTLGILCGP